MSVLLLKLAGPLQSWGSASRFARRTTENAPTKSGVLGLLAAAQGRPREADLSDLSALRYGVRIDQPGTQVRDFQTAHHRDGDKAMPLSNRFYLADAVFVAALQGDPDLLHALHSAVRAPVYPSFLGRRSCPPAAPVDLALHDHADLLDALRHTPWQASSWYQQAQRRTRRPTQLTLLLDCPAEQEPELSLRDEPLSFDPRHRRYNLRGLTSQSIPVPDPVPLPLHPDHDPTLLLGPA